MGRILIVDDEPHMHKILASNLELDRHVVLHAAGVDEARQAVSSNQYEAILTDQKMHDGGGLDVLAAAREVDPNVAVVFLTAVATLELAVESMRKGAFDFLARPATPEVLRAAIQRACEHTTLLRENSLLQAAAGALTQPHGNGSAGHANLAWIEALPPSFDLRDLLSRVEKTLIERTLQSTRGAQAEAARRLGLSRSDLSYKLLKYQLRKESAAS